MPFLVSLFLPSPSCLSSFSQFLFLYLSLHLLCCSWLCCCLFPLFSIPSARVPHSGIRLVFWSCVFFFPFRSSCTSFHFPFSVCLTSPIYVHFFFLWRFYQIPGHSLPLRFFAIALMAHATLGRTPKDEWLARRSDMYLTTYNTHTRQKSMLPAGFEPTFSSSERLQTHALDREATGTSHMNVDYTCCRDCTFGIVT